MKLTSLPSQSRLPPARMVIPRSRSSSLVCIIRSGEAARSPRVPNRCNRQSGVLVTLRLIIIPGSTARFRARVCHLPPWLRRASSLPAAGCTKGSSCGHQGMPDLVTHFGTSYLAFRPFPWRVDPRLLFLGALLPDIPWILARVLRPMSLDPIALYAFLVPFSTPLVVIFLAGLIALLHERRIRCFLTVVIAGLLHIGLDTLQTRPVDGPILFYPFSYRQFSLQWFWPEDAVSYIAVAGSAIVIVIAMRDPIPPMGFRFKNVGTVLASVFLCGLLALFTQEGTASVAISCAQLIRGWRLYDGVPSHKGSDSA